MWKYCLLLAEHRGCALSFLSHDVSVVQNSKIYYLAPFFKAANRKNYWFDFGHVVLILEAAEWELVEKREFVFDSIFLDLQLKIGMFFFSLRTTNFFLKDYWLVYGNPMFAVLIAFLRVSGKVGVCVFLPSTGIYVTSGL